MPLITHEYESAALLTRNLAEQIIDLLGKAIKDKNKASLVVSGGSTPKPLFELLSHTNFAWDKVTITLADERWVSNSHKDSNEKLVRDNLLQDQAKVANFVGLTTEDHDAKNAEVEISARLDAIDSQFDVLILGMGEDGHTASLFPCSEQISAGLNMSRKLSAIATQPTTAPYQRMSMSLAKIVNAKKVFFALDWCEEKAVLQDALANHTNLEKAIKAVCEHTTVDLMWAP